jgi:hypothetical protein
VAVVVIVAGLVVLVGLIMLVGNKNIKSNLKWAWARCLFIAPNK